jgi:ERF superfamily
MDAQRKITKGQITFRLAYREGFLCVLGERSSAQAPESSTAKLWYPIREAEEAEVQTLLGRPVTEVDPKDGIYIDEEGAVFQLAEKGATEPMAREEIPGEAGELSELLTASLKNGNSSGGVQTHALQRPAGRRRKKGTPQTNGITKPGAEQPGGGVVSEPPALLINSPVQSNHHLVQLNLRQKLAEVRRRIGYIQKRGFNERNNYSYVTAADLAGAVGDILAELGVVIIPSLESIAYESGRGNGSETARSAQVVMAYTFTDVDTGEAITTKVAGQGLDAGDKAPYKAMTGALKYALLQSFLLATGDDPEDERINHSSGNGSERIITPEEARQLRVLVEETETELDRVLSYYKINSLEEMRESSYRRAVDLLNRKRAKQTHEGNSYAQD